MIEGLERIYLKTLVAIGKKLPPYKARKVEHRRIKQRELREKIEGLKQTNKQLSTRLATTQKDFESTKGLAAHLRFEIKTILKSSLRAPGLRQMDTVAVNQSGLIYGQTARSRKTHGDLIGNTLERLDYDSKEQTAYINRKFYTLVLEPITEIRGKTHKFGYLKRLPAEKRLKKAIRHGGEELAAAIRQVVRVSEAKIEGHVY